MFKKFRAALFAVALLVSTAGLASCSDEFYGEAPGLPEQVADSGGTNGGTSGNGGEQPHGPDTGEDDIE